MTTRKTKTPRQRAEEALGVAQRKLDKLDNQLKTAKAHRRRVERAGLNMYAARLGAFDRATVQLAELFATQAAALLEYAEQVEQLSESLHT